MQVTKSSESSRSPWETDTNRMGRPDLVSHDQVHPLVNMYTNTFFEQKKTLFRAARNTNSTLKISIRDCLTASIPPDDWVRSQIQTRTCFSLLACPSMTR